MNPKRAGVGCFFAGYYAQQSAFAKTITGYYGNFIALTNVKTQVCKQRNDAVAFGEIFCAQVVHSVCLMSNAKGLKFKV